MTTKKGEVTREENQLVIMVKESGLDKTKADTLLENFQDYFKIAGEWEKKAKMLTVNSGSQITEMKMAREGRLFLREKRIAIEKTRKELKEQALREGKAIDGIANVLKSLIVPIEDYLDKQEHFIEIKEAERAEALRIEAEKKAEEERIAEEKRIAEEQEKIRLDNIRLQKEAEVREKRMKEERQKAEAERLKQEEILRREREESERKQRDAEAKAEAERIRVEAEKKRIEESARIEREKIEQEARIEKEKADKIIAEEKAEKDRIQKLLDEQIECPKCHHKFNI